MLSAFRRLSKSTIGTVVLVLFLLAIVASFAIADIGNVRSGAFGSSPGTLAEVGDEKVSEVDMSAAMRRALDRVRQQDPEATYAAIAGQFEPVLNQLIDERALLAFAGDYGFILSKRLVDAEIANLPQTRGLDGKFSPVAYAAFLQQQQMTDAEVRHLLRVAITQRLILAPAVVDTKLPLNIARPYANMLLEQRQGELALVPVDRFMAGLNPSDGDLQAYYTQNRARYMVPEQRVLRYARIDPAAVAGATPTDAEIAAYYRQNQAQYAGSEQRVISHAVVQDKRQADAIAARARSGASFAAAAAPAGLSAEDISVGPQTRAQYSGLAGDAAANAAFTAAKGAIVGPVRSDLGWVVVRVDDIRGQSGKSLAAARDEIAALLTTTKRRQALDDLIARIEDQIADGASFAEAAGAAKLAAEATPPIDNSGRSRARPDYRLPDGLEPVVKAGFAMSADDPAEVIALPNEAGFVLVGVDQAIEAAPAPLAQIRDRVRDDWINSKATDRARAIATEIAAKVGRGVPMSKAVVDAKSGLPPVESITARRIQISQAPPEAVAPLRMLFSLRQGGSRLVADPRGRGFVVVKTNKIVPGDASSNPTLIAQTQADFQQAMPEELAQQLLLAMKSDQGVERNESAIRAARQRLIGSGE